MAVKAADLRAEVDGYFGNPWKVTAARLVPNGAGLTLGNTASTIEAVVLYADLTDSTRLVDSYRPEFAAAVYKSFLSCAGKIIRDEGGEITAYDGDRIMAIYADDASIHKSTKSALKIRWAMDNIIRPALKAKWKTEYVPDHRVGLDISTLFVSQIGIRGNNDLVWVGRAANYAAKLATLDDPYTTWCTDALYQRMPNSVKLAGGKGASIWTPLGWSQMNKQRIWATNSHWTIS